MLEYKEVRRNEGKFLALTSLTDKEFKDLLAYFEEVYGEAYQGKKTLAGIQRKRAVGGGRKSVLDEIEQKLLFILVYQKDYPLQVIRAELFGISQSSVNDWLHLTLSFSASSSLLFLFQPFLCGLRSLPPCRHNGHRCKFTLASRLY
jgi:hypothetical protein